MKKVLLSIFVVCLCIFFVRNSVSATAKEGWYTVDSHKVYYVNGKKYTKGWLKIDKYDYFFEAKTGYMAKNKIIASKNKGYCYVGKDGIACTDPVIKQAIAFIRKHSSARYSNRTRFKQCWRYILYYNRYKVMSVTLPAPKALPSYAKYMFDHFAGNCYRFTAALTYIAKVLGYNPRMVIGYLGKKTDYHAWVEVKRKDGYLLSDASFNHFMIKREQHKRRPLGIYNMYHLDVKKGKVIWCQEPYENKK